MRPPTLFSWGGSWGQPPRPPGTSFSASGGRCRHVGRNLVHDGFYGHEIRPDRLEVVVCHVVVHLLRHRRQNTNSIRLLACPEHGDEGFFVVTARRQSGLGIWRQVRRISSSPRSSPGSEIECGVNLSSSGRRYGRGGRPATQE